MSMSSWMLSVYWTVLEGAVLGRGTAVGLWSGIKGGRGLLLLRGLLLPLLLLLLKLEATDEVSVDRVVSPAPVVIPESARVPTRD